MNYFGCDRTNDDYELIALAKIHANYRVDEALLYQTKWFDYRRIHPAKATYLFAHQYLERAKRMFAETKDLDAADNIAPFSPADVFMSSEATSMWVARQTADRYGMKYEWFISFAFRRCYSRLWHFFPRPNQLNAEEIVLDARDAWKQWCRESLQRTDDKFFTPDRFIGHPDQIAYQNWLVEQIKKRAQPHMALSTLIRERVLPLELVGSHFDLATVQRAVNFA